MPQLPWMKTQARDWLWLSRGGWVERYLKRVNPRYCYGSNDLIKTNTKKNINFPSAVCSDSSMLLSSFYPPPCIPPPPPPRNLGRQKIWWESYGIDTILDEDLSDLNLSKVFSWCGFDRDGRPCLVYRVREHINPDSKNGRPTAEDEVG